MASSIPNTRLARTAIHYAGTYGWRIHPLRPRQKSPPLFDGWPEKASNDPALVAQWWERWPQANIALATGPGSGVVVVDVDLPGMDTWQEWQDLHGAVDTLESLTGSGGAQLFFQAPEVPLYNTQSGLAQGIDTRGHGGYVVLPPSVHPCGDAYEWVTYQPPAPMPDWLLDLWRAATPASQGAPKRDSSPVSVPTTVSEALASACAQWGLKQQRKGDYAGACPFPHRGSACDCEKGFHLDPSTGRWKCFCTDHVGVSGGGLRQLQWLVQLPEVKPATPVQQVPAAYRVNPAQPSGVANPWSVGLPAPTGHVSG